MRVAQRPAVGNGAPAQNGDLADDTWFVAVTRDDIRPMSVDQMDAALDAGVIDTETLVWRAGMQVWSTLRKVASLDESASPASSRNMSVAPDRSSAGAPPVASPVSSSASEHQDFLAIAHTPRSLAPMAISAEPLSNTVPASLRDESMKTGRPEYRFRVAPWLIAMLAIASGGFILLDPGHWRERWLSRSDATRAEKGAAPPALGAEPLRSDRELEVEAVSVPKLRVEDVELVRITPVTSMPLDAAEPTERDAKTDEPGQQHRSQKRLSPSADRSKRGRRSGTAEGRSSDGERSRARLREDSPATVKDAKVVGTEADEADSSFDPLNDSLP
jgi:hypothetical protein